MLAVLILAAGSGSRMGRPKASVEIDGVRMVDRAVNLFISAGFPNIYLVLGAWIDDVSQCTVLVNENWQEGMGSSLRVGLSALQKVVGIDEVLISLVDLPGLTLEAIREVVEYPHDLVAARYEGEQGHPVKIGRSHWAAILDSLDGEAGARNYLASREDLVHVNIENSEIGKDVDTLEDLEAFRQV
jgi:nicotine blue oxidoreductase